MSYEVIAVPRFTKELKKLAKKYPSLISEFADLITSLEADPTQEQLSGRIAIRYGWQLRTREKESLVERV